MGLAFVRLFSSLLLLCEREGRKGGLGQIGSLGGKEEDDREPKMECMLIRESMCVESGSSGSSSKHTKPAKQSLFIARGAGCAIQPSSEGGLKGGWRGQERERGVGPSRPLFPLCSPPAPDRYKTVAQHPQQSSFYFP